MGDILKEVFIHETAIVSDDAQIGRGTKVWHHAQVREGANIGKNCVLGKDVYVGKDVKIGDNVKMENRATIYRGVTIEDNVFIGPHVTFTNDLYPRSLNKDWKSIPTLVKEGASIGANSTVLCGITIGKHAMIGIGSVVTRNVPNHALVFGNPASLKGYVCECGRKLEKIRNEGKNILMRCNYCHKKIKILKGSLT